MSTLLTSSPSSYDWKTPSKWLSPPCSTCTGHTAPRCTPCTQRWPPAAAPPARSPPHQPPPSWRPVVRPACCHNYPPPPLLRSHVTYRRRCVPAGDVYALTARGGLSFARECDLRAQFLHFTCLHCARALSNTSARTNTAKHTLSHPRPTPPARALLTYFHSRVLFVLPNCSNFPAQPIIMKSSQVKW